MLGPQYAPTTITTSKVLPVGTYLITANVGVVMGPLTQGTQDGAVCAVNDTAGVAGSIFGWAGNGALRSGTGPNGIYGTAVMDGTMTITQPADQLRIVCNATDPGHGTYAAGYVLDATVIPRVVNY